MPWGKWSNTDNGHNWFWNITRERGCVPVQGWNRINNLKYTMPVRHVCARELHLDSVCSSICRVSVADLPRRTQNLIENSMFDRRYWLRDDKILIINNEISYHSHLIVTFCWVFIKSRVPNKSILSLLSLLVVTISMQSPYLWNALAPY